MSDKKLGRPSDSVKDTRLQFRFDKETLQKLDYCTKIENSSRAAIVRKGIEKVYIDDQQKK